MNSKQKRNKMQQLIAKFGGKKCWWCDQALTPTQRTLDHLIPKSLGGSNSIENLRISCFYCNNSRGNSLYPPKGKQLTK